MSGNRLRRTSMRYSTSALFGCTRRNAALLLMGFALLLTTVQLAGAQITYAIGADAEGGQVCGTVNLVTGHWNLLNSRLDPSLVGIGQFNNNLYGGAANGLYQVNPTNCSYIPIGRGSENLEYVNFGSTAGTSPALYGIALSNGVYLYLVHA